jgi:hypothetical protein
MNSTSESVDISLLDFYRQYSSFTDPGEYAYSFANLPDSLPELCSLIKSEIIHFYNDLPRYIVSKYQKRDGMKCLGIRKYKGFGNIVITKGADVLKAFLPSTCKCNVTTSVCLPVIRQLADV